MSIPQRADGRPSARWGRRLLWALVVAYLLIIGFTFAQFHVRAEGGLPPTLMEFTPTYGASLQLRDLPAASLYQRAPMVEYTRRTLPAMYPTVNPIWLDRVAYAPWLYPPHFIFLIVPLAFLPYWWAYLAWIGATALPYLAAIRTILPQPWAWPVALAAPAVFYNTLQGQTGFLTAGFIGLGLALIPRRPVLAGICIGLASVKPHFGLLIPVALLAGAYWRVAGVAALTVLVLVGASALTFGSGAWAAFFAGATTNLQGFESSTYNYIPMTTVLSSFAILGTDLGVARAIQFAVLLLMLVLVAWVWWRGQSHPGRFGLQCAILCIAAILAVPMAYIYDLVLVAPAIAWIGMDLHGNGARRAEWWTLIGSSGALLTVVTLANSFDLQLGPVILVVLLILALRRYWRAPGMDANQA